MAYLLYSLFVISLLCCLVYGKKSSNASGIYYPHPTILIPGDGGCRLMAVLNKTKTVRYICDKTSGPFTLWLNLELLVPYVLDCFLDNILLRYDNATGRTSNNEGVSISVPGFGNTSTVEYLDPSMISAGYYFNAIVDSLVNWGYERGVSVVGAPYDFRLAADEQGQWFRDTINLIEKTYESNGRRKVVLLSHSLGCHMTLFLLNSKDQAWKDKYVHHWISLSCPFSGSLLTVETLISGYNLDQYFLNPLTVRLAQRTYVSSVWLLPNPAFWPSNQTLVQTTERNYTVNDYEQLFSDIKYPRAWQYYKNTKDLTGDLAPPHVPVTVVHCAGVKTPAKLSYGPQFPDVAPTVEYGDGDGTVGMRSLRDFERWIHTNTYPVKELVVTGSSHTPMLQTAQVVGLVNKIIIEDLTNK